MEVYPVRIPPGEEVISFLQQFVIERELKAAFVLTCVGSITGVNLRFATNREGTEEVSMILENMEICSLVGTISQDGSHLHGTFGNAQGETLSGHIMGNMRVQTTAEIVIGNAIGSEFKRVADMRTGFKELVVEKI